MARPDHNPTMTGPVVDGPGGHPYRRLAPFEPGVGPEEGARRFYEIMRRRRTVRAFSGRPVSRATIEWVMLAAGTAPSGANKQPWKFIAVGDPDTKSRIRVAAEAEERAFYERRASERWLADLAHLGTDASKPFLETAPWLIVVMACKQDDDGGQVYYLNESVGIACGMLLAAAHHAGLATLTHTPSPMGFLREVLDRPETERPYLLVPMGHPADDCLVPDIGKKALDEIGVFVTGPGDKGPGAEGPGGGTG